MVKSKTSYVSFDDAGNLMANSHTQDPSSEKGPSTAPGAEGDLEAASEKESADAQDGAVEDCGAKAELSTKKPPILRPWGKPNATSNPQAQHPQTPAASHQVPRGYEPMDTKPSSFGDGVRGARVAVGKAREYMGLFDRDVAKRRKKTKRDARHARTRVAFFRFSYYDIAFKFFVEQVLDADFISLPPATNRTFELGSQYSSDQVCAPFKHILGDYIEALELGADVLVQFAGPCRLGYYGELQESILRDLGYKFDMINFSTLTDRLPTEYIKMCKKKVNPNLSVPHSVRQLLACAKMVELLDQANDFYLANAGFEVESGSFLRTRNRFFDAMRICTNEREIVDTYNVFMDEFRTLPVDRPSDPIRIGVVGEFFTAPDEHSNLELERKLLNMGVEVHRAVTLTGRWFRYNEENLRASLGDYVRFDMGPTSSLTLATALRYAQEGFDGIIHVKSSGCTPEIDCMPVLQRIAADQHIPILYLSYDSQTSDTGLDTRLEAFYDMLAMKKAKKH